MDSASSLEVTELLRQWEEQHTTQGYDPVPTLTRIAEIIELETQNFMKKDPDPFDERHPSRTDPDCALGHSLKVMFKKDAFMAKLVNDYIRENYYSRQNITGLDVFKLNVAACRLTLDVMPGLEMSVVFQENDSIIQRLVNWAIDALEPLRCYATGLLAAAMEVQEVASNFRDLNSMLVPLMLNRLRDLTIKCQEEKQASQCKAPMRHFARFDKQRANDVKSNGATSSNWGKDEGGGGSTENEEPKSSKESDSAARNLFRWAMMSTPPPPSTSASSSVAPPALPLETSSSSSWVEMEAYVIGNIQMHPPTDATKQMLILRYLTPMGEYQEFLSHVFEQNALGLILGYLNVRETRDSRLAFEALKYLAALLCHRKFSIEFINMGGMQKFLEVPRPSVAATGVSICLYYLAYCEEAIERVCLLPKQTLTDLVNYALWLLECSHDSGRCRATMFFGLCFQFRVILEEFDNQDGLRKLYNIISTLPILGSDEEDARVTEEAMCAARQIVRHVCVALRRYLEAHLGLRAAQVARQQGDCVPELPPCKASKLSPEENQEHIELLMKATYTNWAPVDELVELGGITLLLQVIRYTYDWNFNGRMETVRSALDVIAVCCISPRVQLLLTDKLILKEGEVTTGINIVLGSAVADVGLHMDADVQYSALNVLVICVCTPIQRVGSSSNRFSLTVSGRKRTLLKSYEDVMQKMWESVRINNGIMVLLALIMIKSPITDADRLRGMACRALAGLARCPTVRQIISKLPLFTTSQIQVLMRDPILQEKRQEHVMFQKYALELLERVSGKSKLRGAEFESSLANIHRANVVAQTRINYNEKELLQLVAAHLKARGLHKSADMLHQEAKLPLPATPTPAPLPPPPPPPVYSTASPLRSRLPLCSTGSLGSYQRDSVEHTASSDDASSPTVIKIRKVQPQISSTPPMQSPSEQKRSLQKQMSVCGSEEAWSGGSAQSQHKVTLHNIITEYLYNQHSLCKNPVVTCPQFNLYEPHKCPEPHNAWNSGTWCAWGGAAEPLNVCARLVRRELTAVSHPNTRHHQRLAHAHFALARTLRLHDDSSYFTYTVFHPTQQRLLTASSSGVIQVFNLFNGVEENSYQIHDSYIYHMQASRDGLLLLESTTATWRPLSSVWRTTEFEQLFKMDTADYAEFSKFNDERIIGTKAETATIYDTRTGLQVMSLSPNISNMYLKNRATFNPTDELVLSDGVLWDVNSGKEIHKFDKLNQTYSGVFHPNGLEIISNTEVWDLRTFHLLKTVPTLDKSEVTFSPTCSALYALGSEQDSEERTLYDTSFKTLDPYDYSSIATIDVKRNIYALSVSKWGTQIALVENMGDCDSVQESCVKIYDVGRKRDHGDADEDDDDEMGGGRSDNDDGSDSDNDDELSSSMLRDAVLGLAEVSDESSQRDENYQPPMRRRRTRRAEANQQRQDDANESSNSDLDLDNIQFEFE